MNKLTFCCYTQISIQHIVLSCKRTMCCEYAVLFQIKFFVYPNSWVILDAALQMLKQKQPDAAALCLEVSVQGAQMTWQSFHHENESWSLMEFPTCILLSCFTTKSDKLLQLFIILVSRQLCQALHLSMAILTDNNAQACSTMTDSFNWSTIPE